MKSLSLVLVVVALAGQGELRAPVTDQALFDPRPEMWGLRGLNPDTGFDDLDASIVLFLNRRSRFQISDGGTPVYWSKGKQLVTDGELAEADIAERVQSGSCLCALSHASSTTDTEVQVAAGVFRLSAPPYVERNQSSVRISFEFVHDGQPEHATLVGLDCWLSNDVTLSSLTAAMPSFAMLAHKVHPGFVDPAMDDRPVLPLGTRRKGAQWRHVLTVADEQAEYSEGRGSYGFRIPERLDAPELIGTAKPGFLTWLNSLGSSKKVVVDYSDYFADCDPYQLRLDRRDGIHFRDPAYWP